LKIQKIEQELRRPDVIHHLKTQRREWERAEQVRDDRIAEYFFELHKKGVDVDHLLDLMEGLSPEQPFKLPLLISHLKLLAFVHREWPPYNRALRKLWMQYRGSLPLLEDQALRPETRRLLREDLGNIFQCIRAQQLDKEVARTAPQLGITVVPTEGLSRQRFWDKPVLAFVDYFRSILGSYVKAYEATARFFHLVFESPFEANMVKQRYLRVRRSQAPRRPHR
ncbi:MAG TPA: hypothetical protein VMF59_02120, partial [Bacteroidota bacterium]|nr:hypothetical protein [Bacteroidota bacterium]